MKEGILDILLKLCQHYVETAYANNFTCKHSFPIHVLKRDVLKSFIAQTLISVVQKGRQFYARLMKCNIFGACAALFTKNTVRSSFELWY
jgi:hypothetical protein